MLVLLKKWKTDWLAPIRFLCLESSASRYYCLTFSIRSKVRSSMKANSIEESSFPERRTIPWRVRSYRSSFHKSDFFTGPSIKITPSKNNAIGGDICCIYLFINTKGYTVNIIINKYMQIFFKNFQANF